MKLATRTRTAAGFTLVELLVVLTIILVVLALSGAAYQKAADAQRGRSTDDLLNRLQPALDAEYDSVVKQCAQDRRQGTNPNYQAVLAWCDNDPDRAQSVWTAANLRRQFPQSFAEVAAGTVPVCPGVALQVLTTFNSLSVLTSSSATADFESAALLYAILSKKAAGGSGGFAADDVTNGMQMDIAIGGGTAKVFRDAWGKPVCFYLWWQGAEVQQAPYLDTKPGANPDPLDPLAKVYFWKNADGTPSSKATSNSTSPLTKAPYLYNGQNLFNNQNRIATVWSYGRNGKSDSLAPGTDDRAGFRLRRLGTSGGNEP